MMDKSWATLNPFTEDYRTGLAKFISNSLQVSSHDGNIKCPCAKCLNRFWLSNKEVKVHLIVEGMDRSYLKGTWVWHGETFGDPLPSSQAAQQLVVVNTPYCELGPLLEDIFSGPNVMGGMLINNHSGHEAPIPAYARKFEAMVQDANTELYPGCGMKKMDFLIRVFQNNCLYGCNESAMQANLQLFKHILSNGHSLPKKVMSTKGLLKKFMLRHQKIHACENDYMLYWKHNSGLDVCHIYGVSRYTTEVDDTAPSSKKRIRRKVLAYFPFTPRLQRLYMSRHTSEDMCWHALSCPEDGFLRHPIERFMLTLKKYVRNKNRPEGSMTQGYLADECLSFCAMYLEGVETRLNRPSRNANRICLDHEGDFDIFCTTGHSLSMREYYHLDNHNWEIARSYVLANCDKSMAYRRSYVETA
ncbi:hypothetical protein ACFX1R_049296 [Malus domestica]